MKSLVIAQSPLTAFLKPTTRDKDVIEFVNAYDTKTIRDQGYSSKRLLVMDSDFHANVRAAINKNLMEDQGVYIEICKVSDGFDKKLLRFVHFSVPLNMELLTIQSKCVEHYISTGEHAVFEDIVRSVLKSLLYGYEEDSLTSGRILIKPRYKMDSPKRIVFQHALEHVLHYPLDFL